MKAPVLALFLFLIPTLATAQIGPLMRVDSNYGSHPTVAFDAGGNAIVLYSEEGGAHQIIGDRFNGLIPMTEFPVNTTAGDYNLDATVTTFPDRGFVAGWTNMIAGQGTNYFRRFDNTNAPLGNAVAVPLTGFTPEPFVCGIATAPSGAFDLYWYYLYGCGVGYCNFTYGDAFDSAGNYLSVKSYIGGTYADRAAIGSNASGDVVAAYGANNGDKYNPGDYELRYRIGTVGNALGSSTLLTVLNTRDYDVAVAPWGAFVIVWSDVVGGTYRVRAQRFDDQGNAVGSEFSVFETTTVARYHPKVAYGPGGDFLVAWIEDLDGPTQRETRVFTAHVSSLDVVVGPLPISDVSQYQVGIFDVAVSPHGIYAIVFDNSEYVQNQWRRGVWMRTVTPSWSVPVAFAGVWATWEAPSVRIAWELQTDEAVQGLRIYRSEAGRPAIALNEELLPFTASHYIDGDVVGGESYVYHVAAITRDGEEVFSPTTRITTPAPLLRLEQNTPNPFNPSTTIAYSIEQTDHVRLDVYDASGARVASLVDGVLGAGPHEAHWDGVDTSGRQVASGVYFYVLRAGAHVVTRKMALLR